MRFSVAIVGLLVMAGCIDPDAYQKPLTELDIDDTLSIVFIEPRESLILNEAWFSATDPVTGEDWSIRDKWDTVYVNRERGVWVMCRLKPIGINLSEKGRRSMLPKQPQAMGEVRMLDIGDPKYDHYAGFRIGENGERISCTLRPGVHLLPVDKIDQLCRDFPFLFERVLTNPPAPVSSESLSPAAPAISTGSSTQKGSRKRG